MTKYLIEKIKRDSATTAQIAALLVKTGWPDWLLYFAGGIGDDLLISTVCHELKRQRQGVVWVMSDWPELFTANPSVDGALLKNYTLIKLLSPWSYRFMCLNTTAYLDAEKRDVPPETHLAVSMCQKIGLARPESVRPYFYLTEDEQERPLPAGPYIVMQTSGASARSPIKTKEWFPDRFQTIADSLLARYTVIQLGSRFDPAIAGATDLRGETSIRESARILSGADLFVGLVGFLMHLARSVDCPSVIVYGGREHPAQSGYAENINLYSSVECAPCWRLTCDVDRLCMQKISSEMVIAAIEKSLSAAPPRKSCTRI